MLNKLTSFRTGILAYCSKVQIHGGVFNPFPFYVIKRFMLIVPVVFSGLHLLAQDKNSLIADSLNAPLINNLRLPASILFLPESSDPAFLNDPRIVLRKPPVFQFHENQVSGLSNITFSQKKKELVLPNLGEQYYFSNEMDINNFSNLNIHIEFGLAKQNTVMSAFTPNYRFVFGTSLEYELTPWLSTYVYGQYITPSINQKKFFDPLQFMNPLFMQTEAGGGMRAKYKNIKTDLGVKVIQDTQIKGINPAGMVNSKMTIGF